MKIISGMFRSAYATLGHQRYEMGKGYTVIPYIVDLEVESGILIFNVLTREIILIERADLAAWTAGTLQDTDIKILVEHWYMIPAGLDPRTMCYIVRACHRSQFGKKGTGAIELATILTTTDCNARCPYCYEAGCNKRTMSQKTALDVAQWIEQRGSPDHVHLKWFGGEPLCNSAVIDTICTYLKEKRIRYSSSMVSNGYLLDSCGQERMVGLWHLNRVQITLDGTGETYNRIKGIAGSDDAFERVMDNIEYLLQLNIRLNIRLNLSMDNYKNLSELVDIMAVRFRRYRGNFVIYVHPLFEGESFQPGEAGRKRLYDEYMALQEQIDRTDLGVSRGIPRIKHCRCMADDGKSVVIFPEGELGLCEHHCDDEFYGTIYDDAYDMDVIQSWREPAPDIPECKSCFWHPACTRLKKCPGEPTCNAEQRRYLLYKAKATIMQAYKKYCGGCNIEGRENESV